MFDGLKEKLGRFRKDAEEVAEENAEEVEAEDAESEAEAAEPSEETADVESAPADAATEPESSTEGESSEEAEPSEAPETGASVASEPAGEPPSPPEGAETEAPTSEAELGAESADATAAATESEPTDIETSSVATGSETETGTETDTAPTSEAAVDAESDAEADADEGEAEGERSSRFGLAKKAKSAVRGRVVIEEEDLEDPLWELEMALLESDVEMSVAEAILDQIREELVGQERKFTESTGDLVDEALRDALLSVIGVGQFDFDERVAEAEKPVVIVFTGINGVGKTTSIAKLSKYLEDRGLSSVIANGDTYRAGANEQVREHAENLDTKLIAHEQGGDPAAVIYDAVEYAEANDIDVVLGDTAGRLHTSSDLMEQLAKIDRVVDPDMTLFVDEAVAGQDAVNRAREFDDAAEIDGAILTKADADSQGGAAISVAYVTGKPILFLGTGQGYDDLTRFDPEALVADLLGMEE
ncbi:signal recognition particle receptor protein FtsY (=alpha subunit) [Halarchaeum acidiphilum MH1-52-1]|uniref:Signal recognition particle receptor FtsY n=1 Tax=Halarchaeum acidiphilum MH1-52-1 TaxID=1261545 RepID=U3ABK3_9EURY|nr:signal recognition particle-docking protein FtsY [Halarchaeum acidiphilum]GAD52153.1 signal recognition particle receptor protein FtsY (=alpha subunit) [Halarchaeum acidiphilum MH1-52-1]